MKPGKRIVQFVEFESAHASFAGEMVMTWTFDSLDDSPLSGNASKSEPT